MTRLSRVLAGFALAAALAVAALAAPTAATAATASTAPTAAAASTATVTVRGSARVPSRAPSTETVTYTVQVARAAIGAAVLAANEPNTLPASASSVRIDGVPAPAGTVSSAGAGLEIRLGTGADATHGGALPPGRYSISFSIAVPSVPTGATSVSAALAYTAGGRQLGLESAPVPMTLPDLTVAKVPGSGEDRTLPLGTGEIAGFAAILTNPGASTPAATLTIALPRGLQVDRDFGVIRDDEYRSPDDHGGDQLRCTTGVLTRVTCALGAVDHGTNALLIVALVASAGAPIGHVGTFTVSALAGSGLDAHPGNNGVSASVRFVGVADLRVTLTPAVRRVAVGGKDPVDVTVANAGPQAALDTVAVVALNGRHFRLTGFSGKVFPLDGSSGGGSVRISGPGEAAVTGLFRHDVLRAALAKTSAGPPIVLWNIGRIAPGHSITATATFTAVSPGRGRVAALALAGNGAPPCDPAEPTRCPALATTTLTAVAASSPQPPSPTGPPLAATGPADLSRLVGIGGLAILVGLLALGGAAVPAGRRPAGRHR